MKIGMTRLRKESVTTSDAMSKLQVIWFWLYLADVILVSVIIEKDLM